MSEYNKTNMYFIKLYDSFINSDEIRWIESQERGAEIVLMFIRLMMVAKNKDGGKLARIVGKMITPYDINEMASVTFQTEERVIEALEILQKAELVVKEDDCYTIPKALEFTNQTTVGAVKKQNERKSYSYMWPNSIRQNGTFNRTCKKNKWRNNISRFYANI